MSPWNFRTSARARDSSSAGLDPGTRVMGYRRRRSCRESRRARRPRRVPPPRDGERRRAPSSLFTSLRAFVARREHRPPLSRKDVLRRKTPSRPCASAKPARSCCSSPKKRGFPYSNTRRPFAETRGDGVGRRGQADRRSNGRRGFGLSELPEPHDAAPTPSALARSARCATRASTRASAESLKFRTFSVDGFPEASSFRGPRNRSMRRLYFLLACHPARLPPAPKPPPSVGRPRRSANPRRHPRRPTIPKSNDRRPR
jgi:hypothetical protein